MATTTHVIGDYTTANSIDGSTNFLMIQPGSSSTPYNKINRNVLLGVTGQPMDISTSQNVTNKSFDNSNTLAIRDDRFTLQDSGDVTKQAQFQLSGITTATTRTYTLPNASSTLADISSTQTFTNKTLTSPTITGGTIDQTTITVDAIAGHTTANTGTIYGVAVTAGKLSGTAIAAGTIGTTALATNAVQASQLATNAITLGYAQITGNITNATTSFAQATGLAVTVTIPAGTRRIKITAYCGSISSGTGGDGAVVGIWDGSVTSGGTQIATYNSFPSATITLNSGLTCIAVQSPAAGSKTYNVGFAAVTGGTATIAASGTNPAFILVEAI